MGKAKMQRFVVTGACGQLGSELCRQLGEDAMAKTHENFDLLDFARVRSVIPSIRPDAVVHTAGFVPEHKPRTPNSNAEMWRINVQATANLVKVCAEEGIPFLFISANRVFGAEQRTAPYEEHDTAAPSDAFGFSKLAAECVVYQQAATCSARSWEQGFRWWVVRTGNLYERPWRAGRNFAYHFVSEAKARKVPFAAPPEVYSTFGYVPHVAKGLMRIMRNPDAYSDGIYHLANRGRASWYEVLDRMARNADLRRALVADPEAPNYPNKNTALQTHQLFDDLPTWQEGVDEFCYELKRSHS